MSAAYMIGTEAKISVEKKTKRKSISQFSRSVVSDSLQPQDKHISYLLYQNLGSEMQKSGLRLSLLATLMDTELENHCCRLILE